MGCSEGMCSRRWIWNLDRLCKKCSVGGGGGEFRTESSRSTQERSGEEKSEDIDSKQAGWQVLLQTLPCKTEQFNKESSDIEEGRSDRRNWSSQAGQVSHNTQIGHTVLLRSSAPAKLEQREGTNCLNPVLPRSKDSSAQEKGGRQCAELEGTSLTKNTELNFHNPHKECEKKSNSWESLRALFEAAELQGERRGRKKEHPEMSNTDLFWSLMDELPQL